MFVSRTMKTFLCEGQRLSPTRSVRRRRLRHQDGHRVGRRTSLVRARHTIISANILAATGARASGVTGSRIALQRGSKGPDASPQLPIPAGLKVQYVKIPSLHLSRGLAVNGLQRAAEFSAVDSKISSWLEGVRGQRDVIFHLLECSRVALGDG